jgi:hypothetical protein
MLTFLAKRFGGNTSLNNLRSMKRKSYDTVAEAMAGLKERGYTIDFSILANEDRLVSHLPALSLSPADFEIDDFFRFEGDTDPGDQMIVYAISSNDNKLKGLVVNAYGLYADNAYSAIVKKLNTPPKPGTEVLTDTDNN